MTKMKIVFLMLAMTGLLFAVPQKSWDAIFGEEGQGEYLSAKIDGNIRFMKYQHYGEKQPLAFKVKGDNFDFTVSGEIQVSSDKVEKGFYGVCNQTKEVWISCFNKPKLFDDEELIVEVKGVDLACDEELYAIRKLRVKFSNKEAQKYWNLVFEKKEASEREELAKFRQQEQEKRALIREASTMFKDPRDGQMYRIIDIEGRKWFAQNANFKVDGESWCYEDQDSYCLRSGRLYTLAGAKKACPPGWHLPRDREWTDMLTGLTKCYDGVQNCEAFASKMKATTGWQGGGGTDEYGFTVFSSGYRKMIGTKMFKYEGMGEYAGFWSAQNGRNKTIWLWSMGRMSDKMVRQLAPGENHGYSVRCIEGN